MRDIHVTRTGERIKIADMDDRHLLNTIKMIQHKAKTGMAVFYGSEWCGEMDADMDIIEGEDVLDRLNYWEYLKEAQKRGLT